MNRKEVRKQIKKMTPYEIEKRMKNVLIMQKNDMKKAFEEEKAECIDTMFTMTAWVLNYKCGFGSKRLKEVMDSIIEHFGYFIDGTLSKEDFGEIQKELAEKYKFKIN